MFRAIAAFAFVLLLAAPAFALDRPRLDVLGFSPDGRFFAYRQSGLDVGNVHFADLYIVDTITDKQVEGAPIRVRSPASQTSLQQVRASLDAQSRRMLRRLGLNRALAGVAYVPRDRTQMYFDLPWSERALMSLHTLIGMNAPGCTLSAEAEKNGFAGFHLTLERPTEVNVIYNDRSIPRARGCPVSYRFASGFIKPRGNDAVVAAVVAYREPLENGDMRTRYLAVTTILSAPGGRR